MVVGFIASGKTLRALREYPTLRKERKGWGTRIVGSAELLKPGVPERGGRAWFLGGG